MLNTLMAAHELATNVLPLAAPAGGGLNSPAIVAWVIKNIIPLIVMFIGLMIILGARKGDYSKTMATVGLVIVGFALIGSVTVLRSFADSIVAVMFG